MRRQLLLSTALCVGAPLSLVAHAQSAHAGGLSMQSMAAAQAEGYSNSAVYNSGFGMAPGQENAPITGSDRDANGNLMIVNGVMSGAGSVSQQTGLRQSGSGTGAASATAIGNSLNVTVSGTWNTVIVDSQQTNTGNQSATASLNGNLKF